MKVYFLLIFAFLSNFLAAQQLAISGTVVSCEDNTTLPGVSVSVKGTSTGTITDVDGKYLLNASAGDVLVFSFVGMTTEEIEVASATSIDVSLCPDLVGLSEVVVTALGIEKKSRSLTYATQQVDAKEITSVKNVNMINSLAGKSAGLVITGSSSGVGGSSRVIIRGNKSISSENQPLYVIDGVPMNNSSFGQIGGNQLGGTVDGGDAISNINPADIESINVLKGAAASALYGSMGQNGVILITTKKGKAGVTKVEISTASSWESALTLPELQGDYGATVDLDRSISSNDPSTWGQKNGGAISTDDLKDFFQTGFTTINSASVTSGNEKNQFYMSYANTKATGIVKTNELKKHNFMVNGSTKINDKLTVYGNANIITQQVENRPYAGFYSNPVGEAYLFGGSSADLAASENGYQIWDPIRGIHVQNSNYSDYNTTNFILDNPYWTINKNPNQMNRYRTIFGGGLSYDIIQGLSFKTRVSADRIDDHFEQHVYATSSNIIYDNNGAYTLLKNASNQVYNDNLLSYNKDIVNDISIAATLGSSNQYTESYNQAINSINGQDNFRHANFFSLKNMQGQFHHDEYTTEILKQSVFGTATVGYRDGVFVDITGRNEWSSTMPDTSYFYYSFGGTAILTEFLGSNNILSFAKLRATYSEVGNELPYNINENSERLHWSYENGNIGVPLRGIQQLDNGEFVKLLPERSKSIELGANIRLLNDAIDFDFTYYKNNVENQLFEVLAPLGAYVPTFYVNAGEIQNSGVEISLAYKYAPTSDFKWTTRFNFASNKNEVISVSDQAEQDEYVVTPYSSTKIAEIRMVKGGEFGDIYTYDFERDDNGNIIVDADGTPRATSEFVKVGNPNSPVSLGWMNTVSYKKFTVRLNIDGKIGGDVISFTESALDGYGRSVRSADARDAGEVVFEGQVVANTPEQIQNWYQGISGIGSNYVYKATNFRLRELAISYDFGLDFANGKIKNISAGLFGRNLFFLYKDAPFDPEMSAGTNTGLQGIEGLSMPSTRSYGFSLKATF